MMKLVVALFFVLNVVMLIWMEMLPDDRAVSRKLLAHDADGNVGALQIQVETGRGYQRLFIKHQSATRWSRAILLGNVCMFFLGAVVLVLLGRERKVTESTAEADGQTVVDQP